MALPLAVTLLCHLLRQWDQLDHGLPMVLGWLLEDSPDISHPPEGTQVTRQGRRRVGCPRAWGCQGGLPV